MKTNLLAYIPRDTPVHKLLGSVKLFIFLLWSILAMVGFDTRIMLGMSVLGIILLLELFGNFSLRKLSFKNRTFAVHRTRKCKTCEITNRVIEQVH
jgi:energy-coupling factor transport system permease protein